MLTRSNKPINTIAHLWSLIIAVVLRFCLDIGNVDKDGRDDDMETASLSEVRSYDVLEMNVNTLKLTFRVSAY